MQDDVIHGSVQLTAACLLTRYLFGKSDCQHGSAVKEHLRTKTLNINTALSPPQYLLNQVYAVLFETEVTLPGHRCSKYRENNKPSVHLCTQFNSDFKTSCMMVLSAPAPLTQSKKAAVVLSPP